jgi:hypothetical protein
MEAGLEGVTGFIWLRIGTVRAVEHGNETSCYIKAENFLTT